MPEEQKTAVNAESTQDVQNVLAELKEEKPATENNQGDADEARIVAEAAKLGEKSEQSEEKSQQRERTFERGGKVNNSKFDPSTQKETDDPVEIRKQVSA
jgi:lupus La protein